MGFIMTVIFELESCMCGTYGSSFLPSWVPWLNRICQCSPTEPSPRSHRMMFLFIYTLYSAHIQGLHYFLLSVLSPPARPFVPINCSPIFMLLMFIFLNYSLHELKAVLFFCVQLISLNDGPSITLQMIECCTSLWLSKIPSYTHCHIFFPNSSADGHLGRFLNLTIVTSGTANLCEQAPPSIAWWFQLLLYIREWYI